MDKQTLMLGLRGLSRVLSRDAHSPAHKLWIVEEAAS